MFENVKYVKKMYLLTNDDVGWYDLNMKTPTCRNCKGTGNVHVEGHYISQPVDIRCWICGGLNFLGMSGEQAKWYQKQYKTLETLRSKSLNAGKVSDPTAYTNLKNVINKACGRLHIGLRNVPVQKSIQFGVTTLFLTMQAELKEYERRLVAIPVVMAQTLAVAA